MKKRGSLPRGANRSSVAAMTTPGVTTPGVPLYPCGDCGVQPGERHLNCDVARCVNTGEQWLQCECPPPGCQPSIWTGQWPGEMEAIEFGWYSYFDVNGAGPYGRWVNCDDDPTHPGATPDLNRINAAYCVWSVEQQRWFKQ